MSSVSLGRVAVWDRGPGARRVLRAVHELARSGEASAVIALYAPGDRTARFVRDADAAFAVAGTPVDTLRAAGADTVWLSRRAPLGERAAVAEACAQLRLRFVGPGAEALRALAAPGAVSFLAQKLGVPDAGAKAPVAVARRLEVVVARDRRGEARVLGVGDTSLRRAGAAVVTETPAPGLPAGAEEAARALALRCAEAAEWEGVCAVAVSLDPASGALALAGIDALPEAGPAIEAAKGIDLVRLALRLAGGAAVEAAPATNRHAMGARIVAAGAGAAPARVELLRLPSGPGVRADAAADEGDELTPGAPLAYVVARAADRAEAHARLTQAVADADVLLRGEATTRGPLLALLARPEVKAGGAGAGLLDALAAQGEPRVEARPAVALAAAAIEAYDAELDLERARFIAEARRGRPRVGPSSGRAVELRYEGRRHRLDVKLVGPGVYRVTPAGGAPADVIAERLSAHEARLGWAGRRHRVLSVADGAQRLVEVDGVSHAVTFEPSGLVVSPMPAVVVAIPVAPGQRVSKGQPIARIESMKVELAVQAPSDGVVREVLAAANAQVDAGAPLVRMDAEGEAAQPGAPLDLGGARKAEPAGARERYLAALEELSLLQLGFDLADADAKRLGAGFREKADAAPADDAEVLAAEDGALARFADLQCLFRRARLAEDGDAKPPLEELWRYLHEPGRRGEGLSPSFVGKLERALAHEGTTLAAPERELEMALLRIQKAYERAAFQGGPIEVILQRRVASPGADRAEEGARAVLDRLVEIGQERFPAIADLAREARYRRFDQPALERLRAAAYAAIEADLGKLAGASGAERDGLVARLVDAPHPLATLLLGRMAASPPALRATLVETLLRRYYRIRRIEKVHLDAGGPCAMADYENAGHEVRLLACFTPASEIPAAVARLARLSADAPPSRELALEVYALQDGAPAAPDAVAKELGAALARAGFPRGLRRAAFVIATPGRGLDRQASQQHFTFRGGPSEFTEDVRHRGVHPMLFKRMALGRLAKFDLERLPAAEGVYLYRGVAKENAKDERLFAVAEVREVAPVRDASGRVIQLPHLERMMHEALAGMRLFQARRPPGQRLEWNRIHLTVEPPLPVKPAELRSLAGRILPATEGLGLEMVLLDARIPDPASGALVHRLLRFTVQDKEGLSVRIDEPTDRPLEPMAEYQQRVVALRRRGLTHPFEIVKMLTPPKGAPADFPPGEFVEHDLDASGKLVPVSRPPGQNRCNMVAGVFRSFTDRYPEGMTRVALLGDPSKAMGSLAEEECRRIHEAIELAERLQVPLEWYAVSAGAKISMESGTENMDWISRVLRKIIEFTQRGGEINVIVTGINVGAQPYWNAEATMLMHTRGILVMAGPAAAMVLTGKEALEYSGSVSAEDNQGIGGYERIMGPNGQAQYRAGSIGEAARILMRHYEHTYVAPGEVFPRRAQTQDPRDRDVRPSPHAPVPGSDFTTVGDVFSAEKNPDRKRPFDIRSVMAACADQDHPPLERWKDLRGGDTGVVWDAHLGGWPVLLLGIESHPQPRLEFVPADGPDVWSAGTLFPQSSKKIARAINAASGKVPAVVLANLSGFDGSPESMRRLQLEYGAEIGRAVVNFKGPFVFCVVSRYHGGAFVVFSKTLREDMEVVAVEGARASVIGGAPAAAVVFAREVDQRIRKDPRWVEAERAAKEGGGAARARFAEVAKQVRSEKLGEVGDEFDRIHSVERALEVGSLDRILAAKDLRPYLVDAVERGIARFTPRTR
jgi:acetyl/propionyl-CoA carboxylase alpha subunit/acetyl-CoA carboxylase carboxyltransferase component